MTDYPVTLKMAILYLDHADENERLYFLDTINSMYCHLCGYRKTDCGCFCSWNDRKSQEKDE